MTPGFVEEHKAVLAFDHLKLAQRVLGVCQLADTFVLEVCPRSREGIESSFLNFSW